MANYSTLIADITAKIYENAGNDITGQDLQDVLLEMVTEMGQSGMVCLGIADGNTNPPSGSDSNIFYIAGEGTYSNFGGLTVNAGEIALFIWDGATWQKQSVTTTDPNKADKVAGATAGDLAGLDGSGNLTDSGVPSNNVAQQDGYYSTLTAGSAENLIGRGTVPAEYTRRTSGGSADIGSGAAAIEKIHGNTIAWNQLVQNGNFANGTTNWGVSSGANGTISASGGVLTFTATGSSDTNNIYQTYTCEAGHTYYMRADVKYNDTLPSTWVVFGIGGYYNVSTSTPVTALNTWYTMSGVQTATAVRNFFFFYLRLANASAGDTINIKNVMCVDLTLAFGAGNEPTAAEFEKLFPLNYYAYNTGSLLSLTGTGIETNGFNQWDEEWQLGNGSNGDIDYSQPWHLCSKNYIPVFPGMTYYFKASAALALYGYDSNKVKVANSAFAAPTNTTAVIPNGVYYIKFQRSGSDLTYNNDICINLSWSGYRNGEYEAYWDSTLALPITTVTSGGSAVFGSGMNAARSYDELTSTKAIKRCHRIKGSDFTSCVYDSTYSRFKLQYLSSPKSKQLDDDYHNCFTNKYMLGETAQGYAGYGNLHIEGLIGLNYLYISDESYNGGTIAAFQAQLANIDIVYELDTPVEYTLDSEVNLNYRVDDFGTETLLPQNNATPTTAPIIYDVRYAMNAVDTLRNLPKNYISKDSMEHILTAMVTAGVISAYTLTWNATNENYDCTITA